MSKGTKKCSSRQRSAAGGRDREERIGEGGEEARMGHMRFPPFVCCKTLRAQLCETAALGLSYTRFSS